tara:strand:+ start:267 stop:470 length:204 start_codon:yes stop_codon:yes gene_type:complete
MREKNPSLALDESKAPMELVWDEFSRSKTSCISTLSLLAASSTDGSRSFLLLGRGGDLAEQASGESA